MAMNNLFRHDTGEIEELVKEFSETYDPKEPNDISVVLPWYTAPLTNAQLDRLAITVNITRQSNSHGIDIYGEVVKFVCECTNTARR